VKIFKSYEGEIGYGYWVKGGEVSPDSHDFTNREVHNHSTTPTIFSCQFFNGPSLSQTVPLSNPCHDVLPRARDSVHVLRLADSDVVRIWSLILGERMMTPYIGKI
jgi:hypothetical protein